MLKTSKLGCVDDLATLSELNEEVILEELHARYKQDIIYTYVGDILIALNPFKSLNIYHKNVAEKYRMVQKSSLPPHIFAVADAGYQTMLGVGGTIPKNQCFVISGESGAGKTESAKLLISQLVELSRGTSQLQQQILQVNPLLEAYGNAQTLMNDNSSRFGKYIQLKFQQGMVIGAKISEYLLEKSRVVTQGVGEENFHIFYYLFAGLSSDELNKYGLGSPDKYCVLISGHDFQDAVFHNYTSRNSSGLNTFLVDSDGFYLNLEWHIGHGYLSSGASPKKMKKNQMMFSELLNAMDLVGFLDEEQEDMFTVLGVVLNLGNIAFDMDENDGAVVREAHGSIRTAAKLMGTKTELLVEVFTSTSTTTRGSVIKRRLKDHQAIDVRDATAKALYGRLFGWIVNKVNQLLAPPASATGDAVTEVGILDIFGFEHFEKNSFEQACINLANEQLQFFFNQHIFMREQEEYRKEGIDWTGVTFVDNKPVLDLFLSKPIGVLALLDEESHFPQSTDHSFVEKLRQNCGGNNILIKSKHSQTNEFGICHYAGKVEYDATGFLEKNRDTLPPGVMDLLRKSDNDLISTIFSGTITRTGSLALQGRVSKGNIVRRTKKLSKGRHGLPNTKKPTVGAQFKTSLGILMERMNTANPHFIRCIKPNTEKVSDTIDLKYVRQQLAYTGVLETTRIRREGYAIRVPFGDFVERYKLVLYSPSLPISEASCKKILNKAHLTGWQIGKSKVFLKYWHTEKLAEQLKNVQKAVIVIQKVVLGFLARRKYKRLQAEVKANAKKTSTFLAFTNSCGNGLFSKQDEMLQQDQKNKNEILKKKALKYIALEFPASNNDKYFPPPPKDALGLPPKKSNSSLEEIEIDDELLTDDMDNEEDVFVAQPDPTKTGYGEMATKTASSSCNPGVYPTKPDWAKRRHIKGGPCAVHWFQKTQAPKGVVQDESGMFSPWFHGIISRRESERLLSNKPVGCFLIRVSESRFGYSLSYRVQYRCKHFMIDQTRSGKFVIVGFARVYKSLKEMVEVHRKTPITSDGDVLTEPCGQESEEEADYVDLLGDPYNNGNKNLVYRPVRTDHAPDLPPRPKDGSLPPPLPARNYQGTKLR